MTLHTPDAVPFEHVHRALVVKLRHHGDVLLSAPVLSVLKNHVPHAEVDALVYADTAPMLSLHPALAQLHTIDRRWKTLGPLAQARAEWRLLAQLLDRKYDLLVVLGPYRRGQWLSRLLRPRWSVAPNYPDGGKGWQRSFTHLCGPASNPRRHTVETNLDALRRIGIQPREDERRLTLVPGGEAEAHVAAVLAEHGLARDGYIHFHPTSRWLFKCWSVERNAELLRQLNARGEHIVLTAAPDHRERRMADDILAAAGVPVVDLGGQLDLKQLAALTAGARLFVGVDSAPMHMAAAMQTPCVVLFGPSGDIEWGPWQVPHVLVASDRHPCRPCGRDGCGGSKISECLTTLPVNTVFAACERLLDACPAPDGGPAATRQPL